MAHRPSDVHLWVLLLPLSPTDRPDHFSSSSFPQEEEEEEEAAVEASKKSLLAGEAKNSSFSSSSFSDLWRSFGPPFSRGLREESIGYLDRAGAAQGAQCALFRHRHVHSFRTPCAVSRGGKRQRQG